MNIEELAEALVNSNIHPSNLAAAPSDNPEMDPAKLELNKLASEICKKWFDSLPRDAQLGVMRAPKSVVITTMLARYIIIEVRNGNLTL